jgi:FHS family L-fucose permease-like MFS transporter
MNGDTPEGPKSHRVAIALTLSMFAIWGLAHRLYDTLLPNFATALSLNADQQSLAGWALSFGYYLMALPAALISRNFGYKSGVVFGLGTFAVGMFLFYPAAAQHAFAWFLFAAVVIGSGLAILEVSADPLVVRMGPKKTAVRRLNIAQALNPLGVVGGFFLGQHLLKVSASHATADMANALVTPLFFIGAGVLFFAFLVDNAGFPTVAIDRVAKNDSTLKSFRPLFKNRLFMVGAGALFFCSSAQVVLWGFAARYALAEVSGISAVGAKDVLLWCLYAFAIGRLVGTALMYKFDASILLAIFAIGGSIAAAIAAACGGFTGVECLVAASFFLSIVFPTIFASSIRDLDGDTKTGAAVLMFAAGSGAAVLALLNIVTTAATVQYVMAVPVVCFAAIAAFALHYRRTAPAV